MPNINADEIITMKHTRHFLQVGGPSPSRAITYAGQDSQYMKIEGVGVPENGDVSRINVHDPYRVGGFKQVGVSKTAPGFVEATLIFLEKHGAVPRQLGRLGCLNAYELVGACGDLSDFDRGWTDHLNIYELGQVNGNKNLGNRSAWGDSDDQKEDSAPFVFSDFYSVGGLSFGEKGSDQISREVIDVTYANKLLCNECEDPADATQWIYAITKSSGAGSPGFPAEVVYTTNGGDTIQDVNIDGFGATEDPLAIEIVGDKLVILGLDAYYYATINKYTGVPGTFTKVSSGFLAANSPNDMYVLSPREIFFAGDGGYIYKSEDITAGVSVLSAAVATSNTLYRIHGFNDTIVAVGASDTVIKSTNRGSTFATTVDSPVGIAFDIKALAVKSDLEYWVGTTTSGRVYYTETGGEDWFQKSFSGAGSGDVKDIVFVTPTVGFILHNTTAPAGRILATQNGGRTWALSSDSAQSRVLNLPTTDYLSRLTFPRTDDATTAVNHVAVGGLAGNGTDGVLLLGIANKV